MSRGIIERNNVNVSGRGKQPMVFAHGFGCDQAVWRFITPAFAEDYRIVLFDYVGAGGSDRTAYNSERYASLHGYAEDILDVCHALELENVLLVGHSVSSMTALLAAIREPELFESLVLISPTPRFLDDPPDYVGGFEKQDIEKLLQVMDKNYSAWAGFLAPMAMQNPDRPELTNELKASLRSIDHRIAREFARTTFFADHRADLPKLRMPALVVHSTDDAIAPLAVGEYVHAQIPISTLRVISSTGHLPHMSAPEETAQVIRHFLAEDGARNRIPSSRSVP